MGRRTFSREFKLEAVKLVAERGMTASQAAGDLEIAANIGSRWVREAGADKKQAFPGRGQMKTDWGHRCGIHRVERLMRRA